MKVGIVSQYTQDNFGNKLQNYALQEVLKTYAGEVITLRNYPKARTPLDLLRQTRLAQSPGLCRLLGKHRRAAFLAFHRAYIHDSQGAYCLDAESPGLKTGDICDLYCAGSDQVWKPNSGRVGKFHFLLFAAPEQSFSYAASFGVSEIPESSQEAFARGLSRIRHLSLREEGGRKIAEALTGRKNLLVLPDPTLLLNASHWDGLARSPGKPLPKRYILAYFLGNVPEERRKSMKLYAMKTDCEILEIMDPRSPFYSIGPAEFLYLVKNARLVCTDSYHGSIFSFLFHRRLAIFRREGDCSGRIDTLVSQLHLQSCLVPGDILPEQLWEPDDAIGEAALERERYKAGEFLSRVFQREAAP